MVSAAPSAAATPELAVPATSAMASAADCEFSVMLPTEVDNSSTAEEMVCVRSSTARTWGMMLAISNTARLDETDISTERRSPVMARSRWRAASRPSRRMIGSSPSGTSSTRSSRIRSNRCARRSR